MYKSRFFFSFCYLIENIFSFGLHHSGTCNSHEDWYHTSVVPSLGVVTLTRGLEVNLRGRKRITRYEIRESKELYEGIDNTLESAR